MVVDDALDLRAKISLVSVEDVMVNQCHFIDRVSGRILCSELIVEIQLFLTDLALLKMCRDLQVAEEIGAVAVDDGDPLLAELLLVVECKDESSDS